MVVVLQVTPPRSVLFATRDREVIPAAGGCDPAATRHKITTRTGDLAWRRTRDVGVRRSDDDVGHPSHDDMDGIHRDRSGRAALFVDDYFTGVIWQADGLVRAAAHGDRLPINSEPHDL